MICPTYIFKDTGQIREIDAYIIPFSPKPDPRQARDIPCGCSTRMTIFPNRGATIWLGGLKHLLNMGLTTNNLIPSRKVVWAVGGYTLMCQGWFPMEFIVLRKTNKQALYICQKIQRLYFSKAACIDVGILPKDLLNPMATIPLEDCNASSLKQAYPPTWQKFIQQSLRMRSWWLRAFRCWIDLCWRS